MDNGSIVLTRIILKLGEDAPVEKAQSDKVLAALDTLPGEKKAILIKRYGIGLERQATLAELMEEYGVDINAAVKMESDAINALRRAVKKA